MHAGVSFSHSPISLLLRQPLSIKKSYAGAIHCANISVGADIFPGAKVLASAKVFDAPMFLYPQKFLDMPMFLYLPRFLDAPMFLYIFFGAYIFVYFSAFSMHQQFNWRKCFNIFRLRLIIVVMLS
jgi:hypothetical protein